MKKLALLIPAAGFILTGCGGEAGDDPTFENWQRGEIYYSYPYDGQRNVSPKAPLILRFSHEVAVDASHFTLLACPQVGECNDVGSNRIALSDPQVLPNGLGVSIQPSEELDTAAHYRLLLNDIQTEQGTPIFPDGGLDFITRVAFDGSTSAQTENENLQITRLIPDGNNLPFMDFSSLRIQFNQNLDVSTVSYGDVDTASGSIELEHAGQTVPAQLLVKGSALTIDPLEDLTPNGAYILKLSPSVRGVDQAQLTGGYQQMLTAGDSSPRATLVQEVILASDEIDEPCRDPNVLKATLTGAAMNCIPIQSTLLGDKDATMQSGDAYAELAFLPNYPERSPLRIARGSLLTGSNIEVKVGGEIPADIETGDISVTFVSDANGFLLPNPYSDAHEAPKQVLLYLDVAMTAENAEANGALSQDLLHVELTGMALVKDGRMEIDAVGIVEPKVMGQEYAFGLLSFHMKSYEDQNNAPTPVADMTPPQLQSISPSINSNGIAENAREIEPVILTFSEPLAQESLMPGVSFGLTKNGMEESIEWSLDGASVIIEPQGGLEMGASYEAYITDSVTDLAANGAQPQSVAFSLPGKVSVVDVPAFITGIYPGFPCAIDKATWDIGNGNHGRCRGGESSDDILPVMPLPASHPIRVTFSQLMDDASFQLGDSCDTGSFRVERVADNGSGGPAFIFDDGKRKYQCGDVVAGQLTLEGKTAVFYPDEPWQDGQWYRVVLLSENQDFDTGDCSSGEAICTETLAPLQTAVLEAPTDEQGGPNLEVHFQGAPDSDDVLLALANLPAYDFNADFIHQASEPQAEADPDNVGEFLVPPNGTKLTVTDTSGLLLSARVGCSSGGSDCPENKFIHITGALDTRIVGYDEAEDAVKVEVYPTLLKTSSIDVYANILLLGQDIIPTGPQVMRIRYENGGPATGWIRTDPSTGKPLFEVDLDLYLTAPYLHPEALGLELTHELYSYELSLSLSGEVEILPNGRMQIGQTNVVAPRDITTSLQLGVLPAAGMTLSIPQGGVKLNYLSAPNK